MPPWCSSNSVVLKALQWQKWGTGIPYYKESAKEPQTGGLERTEISRFTVLGAESLKSWFPGKAVREKFLLLFVSGGPKRSLACIWHSPCVFTSSSFYACVSVSRFLLLIRAQS